MLTFQRVYMKVALLESLQSFNLIIMPKLHEAWPGGNRFCLSCCVTGPAKDTPGLVCIYICQIGMLVPFSIIMLQTNWNITPALPILFYSSSFFFNVFLLLTACTDPGIIPRKPFLDRDPARYKRFLERESEEANLFCQTCYIYRPSRASHCSRCQNCVQIFDHHCTVVGNCIGKRNYRYFSMFIVSLVATIALFAVNLAFYLLTQQDSKVSEIVAIVIVSVIGGAIGVPIIIYGCFHLYLCLAGRTTREVIKNINSEEEHSNRWCEVDEPNLDFFEQVSGESLSKIRGVIAKMRNSGSVELTLQVQMP